MTTHNNTNREIKFRAWDGNNKLMIQVSDLLWDNYKDYELYYIRSQESQLGCSKKVVPKRFEKIILMQYTGLKDKNGVEIYEGDILKNTFGQHWWLYVVRQDDEKNSQFGNTLFCWNFKHNVSTKDDMYTYEEVTPIYQSRNYIKSGKGVEIIGNIYETPELLKENK